MRAIHRPTVWSRRHVIQGIGAGMLASSAARADPRKLTVMSVGGTWGNSIAESIGKPLTAQTGVTMAYDQRPNAQQVVALMAMRNDPTVDVIEVGGPTLGKTLAAGLLTPLDPAIVTNAADVLPAYRTPYVAHRLITPFALAFNTKYVDRATAQARGWSLLLDPKLKGKVAIPKFGWQGETWMNAVNIAIGGSYDDFDPVVAMCRKIIQDNEGLVMESNDQGMSMYQDEEIVAAPFWTGRTYELQDKGLPLDFVYPPGWLTNGVGMAIVKGAPNPELAQRFANLSLDPAVQIALARRFFYLPTNRHAIEAVKDQPRLQIPEADIATAAQLDYSKMVLSADRNLERFNREVIG